MIDTVQPQRPSRNAPSGTQPRLRATIAAIDRQQERQVDAADAERHERDERVGVRRVGDEPDVHVLVGDVVDEQHEQHRDHGAGEQGVDRGLEARVDLARSTSRPGSAPSRAKENARRLPAPWTDVPQEKKAKMISRSRKSCIPLESWPRMNGTPPPLTVAATGSSSASPAAARRSGRTTRCRPRSARGASRAGPAGPRPWSPRRCRRPTRSRRRCRPGRARRSARRR